MKIGSNVTAYLQKSERTKKADPIYFQFLSDVQRYSSFPMANNLTKFDDCESYSDKKSLG